MSQPVYIISGLGADERVFQYLDFSGYDIMHIQWIKSLHGESLQDYALRISKQIKTPHPIIIGMSFGGIMAIEIAKLIEVEKVILIASVKTRKEIPFHIKAAGKFQLHKITPSFILKMRSPIARWFFGIENERDKKIFHEILNDTDPVFLKWAIDKIVNWRNTFIPKNVVHIHGDKDRIFPLKGISADIVVPYGGHFMTVNQSEILTAIIRKTLA